MVTLARLDIRGLALPVIRHKEKRRTLVVAAVAMHKVYEAQMLRLYGDARLFLRLADGSLSGRLPLFLVPGWIAVLAVFVASLEPPEEQDLLTQALSSPKNECCFGNEEEVFALHGSHSSSARKSCTQKKTRHTRPPMSFKPLEEIIPDVPSLIKTLEVALAQTTTDTRRHLQHCLDAAFALGWQLKAADDLFIMSGDPTTPEGREYKLQLTRLCALVLELLDKKLLGSSDETMSFNVLMEQPERFRP